MGVNAHSGRGYIAGLCVELTTKYKSGSSRAPQTSTARSFLLFKKTRNGALAAILGTVTYKWCRAAPSGVCFRKVPAESPIHHDYATMNEVIWLTKIRWDWIPAQESSCRISSTQIFVIKRISCSPRRWCIHNSAGAQDYSRPLVKWRYSLCCRHDGFNHLSAE